jgi:hypothetical protein
MDSGRNGHCTIDTGRLRDAGHTFLPVRNFEFAVIFFATNKKKYFTFTLAMKDGRLTNRKR